MNKLLVATCALALCLGLCRSNAEPAAAEEESPASPPCAVKKGDIATIPIRGAYVSVMNPEPVGKDKEQKFFFGQECGVQYGSKIKAVAVDGKALLVEYLRVSPPIPFECPNGTLFFIPAEDFPELNEQYQSAEKARKEKLEHVKELLKQK